MDGGLPAWAATQGLVAGCPSTAQGAVVHEEGVSQWVEVRARSAWVNGSVELFPQIIYMSNLPFHP
jgi:hypothetical protein